MARSKKKTGKIKFELGVGGLIALAISTMCVLLWVFVLGFWVGQKMMGKRVAGLELPATSTLPPLEVNTRENEAKEAYSLLPEVEENGSRETVGPREQLAGNDTGIVEEKIEEESESTPTGVTSMTPQATQATRVASASKSSRSGTGEKVTRTRKAQIRPKRHTTYFVLQIAAYKKREKADKEAARWARKGYYTKVKRVDLGAKKGVWYRVYLGKFDTLGKAKEFAVKLADTEGLKSYVVPLKD